MQRHSFTRRRRGFTLIELMIAIVIVGILAGLLLAAVNSARIAARRAAVVSDIGNLEKAITDFKLKYGTDIPSSLFLCEQGESVGGPNTWADVNTASPGTNTLQIARSKAILRRIWPDFDFNYTWNSGQVDLNQDGSSTGVFQLSGSECLVFFLGGMVNHNSNSDPHAWTLTGFSKNPLRPFALADTNRNPPLITFDVMQLMDVDDQRPMAIGGSPNGFPEYLDPIPGQTLPYLYASATGGSLGINYVTGTYFGPATAALSRFDLPYTRQNVPESLPVMTAMVDAMRFHNPQSFQIISPGFDFAYGSDLSTVIRGGYWERGQPLSSNRMLEADNITNFSGGALEN